MEACNETIRRKLARRRLAHFRCVQQSDSVVLDTALRDRIASHRIVSHDSDARGYSGGANDRQRPNSACNRRGLGRLILIELYR